MLAYDLLLAKRNFPNVSKSFYKDHIISAILCKELNLCNWLEYGVFMGGSIFQVASMTNLLDHKLNFVGFDDFSDGDYQQEITCASLTEYIRQHAPRTTVLTNLSDIDLKFDIVHIDADHSYTGTMSAFENSLPHANIDAIWIFDDYYSEVIDVVEAVDDILDQGYVFLGGSISKCWITTDTMKKKIMKNFKTIFDQYSDRRFNIYQHTSEKHGAYIKYKIRTQSDEEILRQVY
ncbi:MAG: class I SAM-dependent methyltransferase [Chitinophagia bacterium]|nr:class I SAM-dependent methyltransferase [Chitinophagia bacterium]